MVVEKIIYHVDIDAFYASVEQLDDPSLKGKPVIVGARPGHRGVVSACSYEARRFGIHSAMPISQAYRRCPQGVYLPPRMSRYMELSNDVMALLGTYSPDFHQISVDEAFIDMTGTERLFGPPDELAKRIKSDVKLANGLTLSVGIASNAYLAKLASEAGKPDGLCWVKQGQELDFLNTLELKDLWGVGGKTLDQLHELGITSIPQLRSFSMAMLKPMLGTGGSRFLYNAVRGTNPEVFRTTPRSHSVSSEVTFASDKKNAEALKRVLLELSQHVMSRIISHDLRSKTVCLKLRYHDFSTTNAQKTLRHWLSSSQEIYRTVLTLLNKRWDGHTPVRLLGVGLSGVVKEDTTDQLELFQRADDRRKKVEETVINLKKKMGGVKLTRASLLDNPPSHRSGDPRPGDPANFSDQPTSSSDAKPPNAG